MIAASAANALGVDVADTNISKTTAWRKAKEARTVTAATIKEAFKCPDKVTVHWDGKALTLRENQKSNRVCVYVSGAGSDCSRKLLAVPETPSGTGKAEATLVTDILASWCISKEVIGLRYTSFLRLLLVFKPFLTYFVSRYGPLLYFKRCIFSTKSF